jgi:hypothetical protein
MPNILPLGSLSHNNKGRPEWKDCILDQPLYDQFYRPIVDQKTGHQVYKPAAQIYNEWVQSIRPNADAANLLTLEEVTFVRKTIQKVLRWKTITNRPIPGVGSFLPSENIGPGMTTFEWYKWLDIPAPRGTQTFQGGENVVPNKLVTQNILWGLDYDFSLKKVDIDAFRNPRSKIHLPNQERDMLGNLMEQLAFYKEWFLFRGSDQPGLNNNLSLTGLINDPDIPDSGLDATDVTSIGSVYDLATDLAGNLVQEKFEPPFVLHLSPGVWRQAQKNKNATIFKSDFEYIKDHGEGDIKTFSDIRLNPYLIDSATETNGTGAAVAYKPGRENFFQVESYPMGAHPLPPHGFSGVDMKLIWMGRTIVTRPQAVTTAFTLTTDVNFA